MEKYKEIERSIIKTYRKEIWSKFIKAIRDYNLVEEIINLSKKMIKLWFVLAVEKILF